MFERIIEPTVDVDEILCSVQRRGGTPPRDELAIAATWREFCARGRQNLRHEPTSRRTVIDIARAEREAGTVRKAKPGELGQMAAVFARAFYDDPVFRWGVNDHPDRLRLFERSFRLYLRKLWIKQDKCYTTENIVAGLACQLPGQWKVGVVDQLRLLPSMLAINGRHLPRILRALSAAESGHPTERHYFLVVLGVLPEWQGRGLGAAVLSAILRALRPGEAAGVPS